MRRAGWAAAIALALCGAQAAHAGLRVPYGGQLVAYVFGPPVGLSPHAATDAADRTAQAALFEPLYRLAEDGALVPVLAAGPPEVSGAAVFVPLQEGLRLHDGRVLTPELAVAALEGLAGGAGAHVLAPVAALQPEQGGLRFQLQAPYDAFPRLLASAHAVIAVPSAEAGREVGTGPFQLEARGARGEVELVPFLEHRAGRPFLDRVALRPYSSRSGAAAWARRGEAAVLFGVPDARGAEAPRLSWPTLGPSALGGPLSRVVLRVGPGPEQALRRAAVSRALQRERLVSRFMDAAARPSARLLAGLPAPEELAPTAAQARLDLVVSQTDRAGWQFAKRVQLDLLRGGIVTTLRRVSPEDLAKALLEPGPEELVLASVLPDAPESRDPADALHALLSLAAALGAPGAIPQRDLRAFYAAAPEARAGLLPALEARTREALGLVPLAIRPPGVLLEAQVAPLALTPQGALQMADAHEEAAR